MGQLKWKDGAVVTLRLRDRSWVLGQLLKSPYLVFFKAFSDSNDWAETAAERSDVLFFCAVTRQFLKHSPIERAKGVAPRVIDKTPERWIKGFLESSRYVTVWPGKPYERRVLLLGDRPGGKLVSKDLNASGIQPERVFMPSIPLTDSATIDAHELDVIWTFPQLNERLLLCKQLSRNVDPLKELTFDRPLPEQCLTFVEILGSHGGLADWGYESDA